MISLSFIVTIIVDFFSLVLVNNGNKFEEQAPEYCIIYLYCNFTVFINFIKISKIEDKLQELRCCGGIHRGLGEERTRQ